jgi:hypothetical protein
MEPLIDSIVTDDDGRQWVVEVDARGTWRRITPCHDKFEESDVLAEFLRGAVERYPNLAPLLNAAADRIPGFREGWRKEQERDG